MEVLTKNPYVRTQWYDDIFDPVTGEVLEEGTPYLAQYANNLEDGIFNAYVFIMLMQREMQRMQVQMELDGRAPGNSGTFADTLDGSTNKITLDPTKTDVNTAVSAGATAITVDSTDGFTAFTQVTIFDDVNTEDVLITAVNSDSLTVQALQHSYKKGAKVARSTVAIDTVNKKMDVGNWPTFSVELVEVV